MFMHMLRSKQVR